MVNNDIGSVHQLRQPAARADADKPGRAKDGVDAPTTPAMGSEDRVSLTQRGRVLQGAEISALDADVVDTEKVAKVKAAIADGSYTINATAIADKMLGLEAELYGKG